ncbi:MAG: cobalamin-dependent protein, partial [Alphaproteobacteria bacterium]
MNIVLISTYDLGHQSFGLASPAAWLRAEDHVVTSLDLSVSMLDETVVRAADMVAFYLPMHTATRLAAPVIERVDQINPEALLCAYGLYAPVNHAHLRRLGIDHIVGGEFEGRLVEIAGKA